MNFTPKVLADLKNICMSYYDHKDVHAAEDLMQTVLYKAVKYKNNYEEQGKFFGWLAMVARHEFINRFRKQRNTPKHTCDYPSYLAKQETITSGLNVKHINEQIERLPQKYSEPMKMMVDGYKYNEIAEVLNIPEGTVKSRIFLGRQELVKLLEGFEN